MNCDQEAITHWLNNEMTLEERNTFERHLSQCSSCREELTRAEKLTGRLQQMEIPDPSPDLELRFKAILGDFKTSLSKKKKWTMFWTGLYEKLTIKPAFQLGYSMILLLIGAGVAYLFFNNRHTDNSKEEIAKLSSQVQDMRQMMMLSQLKNTSASERLKAVNYTEDMNTADEQVIDALLTTLNEDPNVNVRLVTLEALTKYSNDPIVREGLVQSIIMQESPLVQSALADVMMKLQEKKSIAPFRKLLDSNEVSNPVRTKIQQTITRLST